MKPETNKRAYHKVLTIAGSDSGGGAGIQADLKTMSAIGCYGMSVVTALTAQNTCGVTGIHPVPPLFAAEQIAAVLSDIGADAIKIGMLYSAELIEVIADELKKYDATRIILDPVMVAQSGDRLLKDDAVQALKTCLMPLAEVVTPNIPEAEVLLDLGTGELEDMQKAARLLAEYGSRSILIKGGHLEDEICTDWLFLADGDRLVSLDAPRISSRNNHGTGCSLSSAIASYRAKGCAIEESVRLAKTYIHNAIRAGAKYTLGNGHGPVHHFFEFWQ